MSGKAWSPKIVQGIDLQTIIYPKELNEKYKRAIMKNGIKVNAKPAVLVEDLPRLIFEFLKYDSDHFDDDNELKITRFDFVSEPIEDFLCLKGLAVKKE